MKIAIAGMGYVGLSLAMLLAQHNEVRALDVVPEKVQLLNRGKSPIADAEIERFLREQNEGSRRLNFVATLDEREAYESADFAIIATPTNYDPQKNFFDTSSVEAAKPTIPVGYAQKLSRRLDDRRIVFSPEFLREGKALYDNLHPSRIVVGADESDEACQAADAFATLLLDGASEKEKSALTQMERQVFLYFYAVPPKLRPSNCSRTPISLCVLRISMGWTLTLRCASWMQQRLSKEFASIRVSATITTIPASAMADIACRKTQSSCLLIIKMFRGISFLQSWRQIAPVKTLLPKKYWRV